MTVQKNALERLLAEGQLVTETSGALAAIAGDVDALDWGNYDDLRGPATGINPPGAAADPGRDTDDGSFLFDAGTDEIIAVQFQMPHGWEEGTTVYPHIHWCKTTSAAGVVKWQWRYKKAKPGAALGAWSAWADLTASGDFGNGDTANKHAIHYVDGGLSMEGDTISTILMIGIQRDANHDDDTYAADAKLLDVDVHYKMDASGSTTEYGK